MRLSKDDSTKTVDITLMIHGSVVSLKMESIETNERTLWSAGNVGGLLHNMHIQSRMKVLG